MRFGEARERCRVACPERPGAAHVDVEPGIGCGDLDVERLPGPDGFRNCPCGGQRAVKRGREHRTTVDPNDVVRAPGRKAHLQHAMRGAARVKHRTPPPLPVRIDQFADRRVEPLPVAALRQRGCASNRGNARSPSAASGSRRKCRSAGIPAGCAPGLRSRRATGGGGPDGRGQPLPPPSRPAACRAHTPARPASRQCHRRGGRDGRS